MQLPAILSLLPALALAAPSHTRDVKPDIESLEKQFEQDCGGSPKAIETLISGQGTNSTALPEVGSSDACKELMDKINALTSTADSTEVEPEVGSDGVELDAEPGDSDGAEVELEAGGDDGTEVEVEGPESDGTELEAELPSGE